MNGQKKKKDYGEIENTESQLRDSVQEFDSKVCENDSFGSELRVGIGTGIGMGIGMGIGLDEFEDRDETELGIASSVGGRFEDLESK